MRWVKWLFVSVLAVSLMGCQAAGSKDAAKGCDQKQCCGEKSSCCEKQCPMAKACGKEAGKGVAYCPKTHTLSGHTGKVHDKGCNKDMAAGSYCGPCNRFMVEGTVHCDKCGKDMPKGKWCAKCNQYMGLPEMSYCEPCKEPYEKAKGCSKCGGGKM